LNAKKRYMTATKRLGGQRLASRPNTGTSASMTMKVGEQPLQLAGAAHQAHRIAQGPQQVITRQQAKEVGEAGQQRYRLAGTYIHQPAQQALRGIGQLGMARPVRSHGKHDTGARARLQAAPAAPAIGSTIIERDADAQLLRLMEEEKRAAGPAP